MEKQKKKRNSSFFKINFNEMKNIRFVASQDFILIMCFKFNTIEIKN